MISRLLSIFLILLAPSVMAQFNLYPAVSPDLLATALNISSGCLSALNSAVDCDQDLFSMAGNVDGFFWSDENATALCTSICLSSAASWWSASTDACSDDQFNAYGRLYPANTVPGRFVDGLNIACVTATSDLSQAIGINSTAFTPTLIDQTNNTVTVLDPTGGTISPEAEATIQPLPYPDLFVRQSSTSSQYCLVESYDWVGSDIIRPDCSDPANANASQCIDPTDVPAENARIANLYSDDLLCSGCFLNMYYLRLASPFLPDTDASDDLVAQWYDILDVCNASSALPDLLVRSLPFYESAPGSSGNWDDNSTLNYPIPQPLIGNQTYNNTCQFGTIVLADVNLSADSTAQTLCDALGQAYNSAAGNFVQALGKFDCAPLFNATEVPAICAPQECSGDAMPANTTCSDFASDLPGGATVTQFLSWNPNLIGFCDSTTAQWVCVGAPGGTYVSPPASNSSTNAGTQQRGGGDGSGTATGSGSVGGAGRNSTIVKPGEPAPSPTQSGLSAQCTQYGLAESGDGCYSFSQNYDITQQALEAWNPVLGSNGENCTTQFFAGYYYCIGVDSPSSTVTVKPTLTPTTSATPSPVQSGIDSQCTTYAEAVSGDTCSGFASENGITPDQLYAWNPVLGSDGANCGNSFWAGEYYCVGVPSGTRSTPTTTSVAVPSPTQTGIASDCNSYAEAVSGDSCYGFAQEHGITTADLYAWNSVLGPNGENCNTELFLGYYYCIGVSSASD